MLNLKKLLQDDEGLRIGATCLQRFLNIFLSLDPHDKESLCLTGSLPDDLE